MCSVRNPPSLLTNNVGSVVEHGHHETDNEGCRKLATLVPSEDVCRSQGLLKRRESLP